jgi:hypothetical protein
MSTGYTKQSTYQNGNVISAELFNSDFNLLQSAFAYSSTDANAAGHTHDGTTGGGGAISKIGDLDFQNKIQIDGSNNKIQFFVEINAAPVEVLNVTATALEPVASGYDLGTPTNPFDTVHINSLTVDTNTLHVDSVNNKVGIGTLTPGSTLTVKSSNFSQLRLEDDDDHLEIGYSAAVAYFKTGDDDTLINFRKNDLTDVVSINMATERLSTTKLAVDTNTIYTQSGNVGIGTISPSAQLHVKNGEAGFEVDVDNQVANGVRLLAYDRDASIERPLQYRASKHIFRDGSAERMRIDNTGNVGIGIISPNEKLDVSRTDVGTLARFGTEDGTNNPKLLLATTATGVKVRSSFSTGIAGSFEIESAGGQSYISLSPNSTEAVRIKSDGNVGIGTLDPNRQLHVSNSGDTVAIKIEATDGSQSSLDLQNTEGWFRLINDAGSFSVYDQSDSAERFRIDTDGKVGIGTSNPSAKLHVDGGDLKITSDNQNSGQDGIPSILFGELTGGSAHAQISYHGDDETNDDNYLGLGVFNPSEADANTLAEQKLQNTLALTRDGKVGIGTTTPTSLLTVHNGDTDYRIDVDNFLTNGTFISSFNPDLATDASIVTRGSLHRWQIGTDEKMRIDDTGYVGIGTNNPAGNLHISAGTSGDATLILEADTDDNNEADNPKLQLRQDSAKVTGELYMEGNSAATAVATLANSLILEARDTNGNNDIQFVTGGANSTSSQGTARMTIKNDGQIGIGTTSPARTLHVTGGNDTVRLQSTGSNTKIEMVNTGSTTNEFGFLSNNFFVSPDGTEALRIDSSGNVGINTGTPGSKLTIKGTGGDTSGFAVSSTNETVKGYFGSDDAAADFLLTYVGTDSAEIKLKENGNVVLCESSGKVGIGTSSPSHTLHVDGSVRIGNASTLNENIYLSYFDETSHATLGDIFEDSGRSAFGGLIESGNSGQLVVGIRNNDNSDGFSVVTGGPNPEWNDDNAYDHEVFSVRSNKVVGINSPPTSIIGATLHVHQQDTTGTNKSVFRASSHGGGGFQIVCSDVAVANPVWNLNTFYGEQIAFGDGTNEHVRIDASGNVGIGTDEPDEALTVAGNVQVEANNAFIQFKDTDAIADRKIRRIYNSEQTLHFSTRNDDGTLIDNHLTIARNGNIGIGTTNPQNLLDIEGSVNGRVDVQIVNNFDDDDETAPNPSSRLYLAATSNNGYLEVHGAPEDSASLHRVELGSTAANSFISFAPVGSEEARVNSYGLFVGNTNSDLSDITTTAGARITKNSTYLSSDSENADSAVLQLNRLSGEGRYIDFRQGTSARGQLSSDTGSVFELKAFTTTLKLTAAATASINFNTTSFRPDSDDDATISLGGSSTRFNNLHLSGTSYSTGAEISGGDLVLYGDSSSADTQSIRFENSGTARTAYIRADYDASEDGNDTSLIFGTNDGSQDGRDRLRINKNGDISFYEDDGTTTGVFWDASEKKLGIGETTPLTALHVGSDATQGNVATFGSASQTEYTKVNFDTEGSSGDKYIISYGDSHSTEAGNLSIKNTNDSGELFLVGGSVEGIRINSSGNVGIKNNNPTEALDVTGNIKASGTVATGGFTLPSTDGQDGQALITDGSGNVAWGSVATDSSGDFGSTALETDEYIRAGEETLTQGTAGASYQIKASSTSSNSPTAIQIANERDYVVSDIAVNKIAFASKYTSGNDDMIQQATIEHLERLVGVSELRLAAGGSSIALGITNNGLNIGPPTMTPPGFGDPKIRINGTQADIRLESENSNEVNSSLIAFVANHQDQTGLGTTTFNGKNASDEEVEFASIKAVRTDDTNGDEKSKLTIKSHTVSLEGTDLNISSALAYEEEDVTTKSGVGLDASAIYNTINDYDGGRWRKSRGASWYNETFNDSTRGSRKEFPEKALIGVNSTHLYIYDATKKDNPLWARYTLDAFSPINVDVDDSTSLQAENGKILVQAKKNVAGTNIHAILFDFAEDIVTVYQGSEAIKGNSESILSTQSSFVQESSKDLNSSALTTFVTKSVCMFVDPHVPEVNERTGLPKACIALAGENATNYANIFLIQNEDGRVKNLYHIIQYTRMRFIKPIPELNTIGAILEAYSQNSLASTAAKAFIMPLDSLDFDLAAGSAIDNTIHTLGTLGVTEGENFHTTSGAQAFGVNAGVTDVTEGFKAFTFPDNSLGFIRTLNKSQEGPGPDKTKLLTCRITAIDHTGWMFPKTRLALIGRFRTTVGTRSAGSETEAPYPSGSTQLEIPAFERSDTVAIGPVASGAELGYYTAPSGSSGAELRSSGTLVNEAFQLSEADDEGFGMSFWIRRTASHSTHTILNWGIATGNELKIDMSSTGEIQVYHKTGASYGSPLLESDATNLNEWINVRVTRNTQSHLMKLYVNGILKDTVDYNTTINGVGVGCIGKFNLQDFYQVSLFKLSHTYEGHSNTLVYEVYKDESQLFKSGAQCALNTTSSNFVAYNTDTNILHVANNNEYSQYDGLVKIYEDTTSALSDISHTISSADNLTMGD